VRYRDRNATERVFRRLKDFRRIGTRYDKLATNFLDAIHLVAAALVVRPNPNQPAHVVLPMRPLQWIPPS
jgi:hypothetical protein